jgi:hypothetical protein
MGTYKVTLEASPWGSLAIRGERRVYQVQAGTQDEAYELAIGLAYIDRLEHVFIIKAELVEAPPGVEPG